MRRRLPVGFAAILSLAFLASLPLFADESPRQWIDEKGRSLLGTLIAADEERCTLELSGGKMATFPISDLNEDGEKYIRDWIAGREKEGLTVPRPARPWPEKASAGNNGRFTSHPDESGKGHHIYRSRHFELRSDAPLPGGTVKEFTEIFEATLAAIKAIPMGFNPKPPESYYGVRLVLDRDNYLAEGGVRGTAGLYNSSSRKLLISLDSIGFSVEDSRLRLDYRKHLPILKHEAAHQVMGDWMYRLPMCFSEGWAEYVASLPYSNGTYYFTNLTEAALNNLNRWSPNADKRRIAVRHPSRLLGSGNRGGWLGNSEPGDVYLNYFSSGFIVHYFLHLDGDGQGKQMAEYLAEIRKARNYIEVQSHARKALDKHLLRGRNHAGLAADMAAAWKRHGVTLLFEE